MCIYSYIYTQKHTYIHTQIVFVKRSFLFIHQQIVSMNGVATFNLTLKFFIMSSFIFIYQCNFLLPGLPLSLPLYPKGKFLNPKEVKFKYIHVPIIVVGCVCGGGVPRSEY